MACCVPVATNLWGTPWHQRTANKTTPSCWRYRHLCSVYCSSVTLRKLVYSNVCELLCVEHYTTVEPRRPRKTLHENLSTVLLTH